MQHMLLKGGKWTAILVAVYLAAALLEHFDVRAVYILWGFFVLLFLHMEYKFEKISMDLALVEAFLQERHPEEFDISADTARRRF